MYKEIILNSKIGIMIKRNFITSLILIMAYIVNANGQNVAETSSIKTLKEVYSGKFLIGTASDLRGLSEAELANVKMHYDIITPENCMKPQPLHPSQNSYNFRIADSLVDWSHRNGVKVWGHTLVWHSQTSPWFFQANPVTEETVRPVNPPNRSRVARDPNAPRPSMTEMWLRSINGPVVSREVALQRLKDHIMTVAGRYKGRVIGWDVVNESIADGGDGTTENLRDFSWYKVVGPDVLTLAFKWTHEADPDAELYYNDYNIEQGAVENKGKHASSMLLLKRLIAEGAPITGVGIQGHWHLDTNLADVEKAIENYASLGLRVSITELDVTSTGNNSGAFGVNAGDRTIPAENYQKQAEVYKKLFEIFMRHADVIDRVTFWGISDTRSWRRGQDALLFNGDLQPKPAFNAVIEASRTK
ncbi:MAG: Endo-1,4-beta-xylanase A precursor [Firmicutes bacterium ADurb.Bin419]|nr:MAG: Endo-1,4-beta-xylanase A precursor [Firmicutes bacterium ADurb.Bin419]